MLGKLANKHVTNGKGKITNKENRSERLKTFTDSYLYYPGSLEMAKN